MNFYKVLSDVEEEDEDESCESNETDDTKVLLEKSYDEESEDKIESESEDETACDLTKEMLRQMQESERSIKFLNDKIDALEAEKLNLENVVEYMRKSDVERENQYLHIVDNVLMSKDAMFLQSHLRYLESKNSEILSKECKLDQEQRLLKNGKFHGSHNCIDGLCLEKEVDDIEYERKASCDWIIN